MPFTGCPVQLVITLSRLLYLSHTNKYNTFKVTPSITSSVKSSQSQSYVTTDGQSASLSWCQAPIWGLRPDFYYCQTVAVLLVWGALSDERTGLPFTIAAGPRQCSHSCVRVPRDSWPYFAVSNSRLPQNWRARSQYLYPPGTGWPSYTPTHWVTFSSPPTT
jgi:hypothetical protein